MRPTERQTDRDNRPARAALAAPAALLAWQPDEAPVLSVYADWRASGRGLHEAPTEVRKQLHTASAAQPARGPARESFDRDVERVLQYLAGEVDPAARGVAIFACHARGYWAPVVLGVPVDTAVFVADTPRVLPLVEASQQAARTLVALVNTHELRLLMLDREGGVELPGEHGPSVTIKHISSGGWLGVDFRRSMDMAIARFADEAAALIASSLRERGAEFLVIGGDEVIRSPLLEALPRDVRSHLVAVEHIDMRASLADVAAEVWPLATAATQAALHARVAAVAERTAARRSSRPTESLDVPAALTDDLAASVVDTLVIDPAVTGEFEAERWLRAGAARHATVWIARSEPAVATAGGLAWTLR